MRQLGKEIDVSELLPCSFCKSIQHIYEDGSVCIEHEDDCFMVSTGYCEHKKTWICSPANLKSWNRRASPWISVKERLPEGDGWYFVYSEILDDYDIAKWDGKKWHGWDVASPTHYMKPQPPKQ